MSKRYSQTPRRLGDLGFQWRIVPDQEILFSELKNCVTAIHINLNKLPGAKAETMEDTEDFAKVTISYEYLRPSFNKTETGPQADFDTSQLDLAEEEIYGPQDKVYNHILAYYPEAAKMFISAWNMAKHKNLKSLTNLRSPFFKASTAQKLSEEFYKAKRDPKQFAEKLKKDKANIYNELKGKRKISVDQAIEYSKEFGCDPVNLLFEDLTTECWGNVDLLVAHRLEETYYPGRIRAAKLEQVGSFYYGKYYPKLEKGKPQPAKLPIVKVPRDIYSPDIKAIKIDSKGSYLNNYIAYYYFSKNQNKSAHGKLAVVGQEWINDDLGIQEISYWFGIYEEKIGGGINLLNPDPLAKNKYIAKDLHNITFVSPVVSLVHPSTLVEDSSRREALKWTDKIFEEQQEANKVHRQLDEFKNVLDKLTENQKKTELKLIKNLVEEQKEKAEKSIFKSILGRKVS